MSGFGLNVELDVEEISVDDAVALTFEWFDHVSGTALTEPRAALEGRGAVPAAPRFVDANSWNPAGVPAQLRGTVEVSDRPRAYRAGTMSWLGRQLEEEPELAEMSFALFAGKEPDSPNVWWPSLYLHRPEESPGWVRLGAYVAESLFLDKEHGVEAQRLWLDLLRSFADRCNPGFGQIEYGFDTEGTTALEDALDPALPLEERDPEYTVGQSRQYLRGYSWLTIVPAELADHLGGAEAIERTGAFAEATPLAGGGVWLLATQDYRDYGPEQVARVFTALSAVLRPGKPAQGTDGLYGSPPRRLFFPPEGQETFIGARR